MKERYVKNIKKWFVEEEELGKIYDTEQKFPKHLAHSSTSNWDTVLEMNRNSNGLWFIPSTKQEYNKQQGIVEQSKKGDENLKQALLNLLGDYI